MFAKTEIKFRNELEVSVLMDALAKMKRGLGGYPPSMTLNALNNVINSFHEGYEIEELDKQKLIPKENSSAETVSFQDGKYTISVQFGKGQVKLLRHGERWSEDPPYAKMFIAILCEVQELREKVVQLSANKGKEGVSNADR